MSKNNPIFTWLLFAIVLGMVVLALASCKSVGQYIPTTNVSQHDHDSVRTEYVHDSVYIDRIHKEIIKGDTVIIHDSIFRDRWHNRDIHDSIYINNTDTIYQTIQVEKKGSAFLRNSGIALWVIIALLIIAVIVGIVLKFAK